MSMFAPNSFRLSFPVGKEDLGILFMDILEDYLKNQDFSSGDYDELIAAEHISKMFINLKQSSYGGTPQCFLTMWILEKLPGIILKYRDKKKGNHVMCSQLWMCFKSMIEKANTWNWS